MCVCVHGNPSTRTCSKASKAHEENGVNTISIVHYTTVERGMSTAAPRSVMLPAMTPTLFMAFASYRKRMKSCASTNSGSNREFKIHSVGFLFIFSTKTVGSIDPSTPSTPRTFPLLDMSIDGTGTSTCSVRVGNIFHMNCNVVSSYFHFIEIVPLVMSWRNIVQRKTTWRIVGKFLIIHFLRQTC